MWQFLQRFSFRKKRELPEAVSQYSLMRNRNGIATMDVYTTLDNTRVALNAMFLAKDRQDSDLNFLNHIRVAEELKDDPRFGSTFN